MDDIAMMREALALAQAAAYDGEVPVGCVVAMPDGRIVGRGRNRREKGRSALAHAELEAIGEACRTRRFRAWSTVQRTPKWEPADRWSIFCVFRGVFAPR